MDKTNIMQWCMYAARFITHVTFLKMKLNERHANAKKMPAEVKIEKMTEIGRTTLS